MIELTAAADEQGGYSRGNIVGINTLCRFHGRLRNCQITDMVKLKELTAGVTTLRLSQDRSWLVVILKGAKRGEDLSRRRFRPAARRVGVSAR